MLSDRFPAAVHEGGHGLVAYLLSSCGWIELRSGGNGGCGPLISGDDSPWCMAAMLIDVAGAVAERLLKRPDPQAWQASAYDRANFKAAYETAQRLGCEYLLDDEGQHRRLCEGIAGWLLRAHEGALFDLARTLDTRGRMSAGQVEDRVMLWGIAPLISPESKEFFDVFLDWCELAQPALIESAHDQVRAEALYRTLQQRRS